MKRKKKLKPWEKEEWEERRQRQKDAVMQWYEPYILSPAPTNKVAQISKVAQARDGKIEWYTFDEAATISFDSFDIETNPRENMAKQIRTEEGEVSFTATFNPEVYKGVWNTIFDQLTTIQSKTKNMVEVCPCCGQEVKKRKRKAIPLLIARRQFNFEE